MSNLIQCIDGHLQLRGQLNLQTVPALWKQRKTWLSNEITQLELGQINSIDSSGLAFLVALSAIIASQRAEPVWHQPQESLIRLMKLYDLGLESGRLASILE